MSESSKFFANNGNHCIRLRGKNGNYLSVLPCGTNAVGEVVCFDLCEPSGKVLYCGIDVQLVDLLCEHLGMEEINRQ